MAVATPSSITLPTITPSPPAAAICAACRAAVGPPSFDMPTFTTVALCSRTTLAASATQRTDSSAAMSTMQRVTRSRWERAAEQRRHWQAGVTGGHVEERGVDGGERERREAEHSRERVEQRDTLQRVTSHEGGRNARLDELDHRRLRLGRERLDGARLPPAHDPLVSDDANQHVRRA